MASFVKAADAVAAAVEIERRGYAFYKSVEEKAAAPDKAFFRFLAEEEQRHEGVFSAMLGRMGGLDLPAGSTDEEYLSYVKALLDSHSLFMPGQAERSMESPLGQAMQFEKDTLLFFMAMEGMVPESEKAAIRACADEEKKHLRMLAAHMAKRS